MGRAGEEGVKQVLEQWKLEAKRRSTKNGGPGGWKRAERPVFHVSGFGWPTTAAVGHGAATRLAPTPPTYPASTGRSGPSGLRGRAPAACSCATSRCSAVYMSTMAV